MLSTTIRKSAVTVAAVGALGLGGAAIAGATGGTTSASSAPGAAETRQPREALSSEAAAKVRAAALAEVPGATVLRAESGGPYATPYHAHVRTSGGALRVVLVDASFRATAVQADRSRGGRGGRGDHRGHGGRGETALTGTTKERVEAAVLARYSGATIVRTETNRDGGAPYEAHIRTSDGRELEVLVSRAFAIVEAREHRDCR